MMIFTTIRPSKLPRFAKLLLIAAFWIALWQLAYYAVGKDLILPSPISALKALVCLLATKAFYLDTLATMGRCVAGIALSFSLGAATALLSYKSSLIRSLLSLPVLLFKSTPVIAVIIFFLLCFTANQVPVLVCFLMCYPVVYTNLLSGLDSISMEYIELGRAYELKPFTLARHIYLPSLMPQIKASLNLTSGLSWKTVVASEVFSIPEFSMGYNLLNAKYYMEISTLFGWIAAIVALSLLFETIIKKLVSMLDYKDYSHSKIFGYKGIRPCKGMRPCTSAADSTSSPICDKLSTFPVTIRHLSKSFDGKMVFRDFSATFSAGKTTAVMAPSGSGKTTLFRILSGFESPELGEIQGLENQKIGLLFQEDRLLPWLNVYDNLALVLKDMPMASPEGIDEAIKNILGELELSESIRKLPCRLSGGMQRRVSLARALIYPSSMLLLDEPFKGLDDALKKRLQSSLWPKYAKNKTILLITHDREDCRLADTIISL